jgi:hypothetical protein
MPDSSSLEYKAVMVPRTTSRTARTCSIQGRALMLLSNVSFPIAESTSRFVGYDLASPYHPLLRLLSPLYPAATFRQHICRAHLPASHQSQSQHTSSRLRPPRLLHLAPSFHPRRYLCPIQHDLLPKLSVVGHRIKPRRWFIVIQFSWLLDAIPHLNVSPIH